ncbi:hypothetical protein M758_UG053500 [Ceratodon purpureus]|nr:hypothetical protein M758_UG053500 [Ceratodon purpureus]
MLVPTVGRGVLLFAGGLDSGQSGSTALLELNSSLPAATFGTDLPRFRRIAVAPLLGSIDFVVLVKMFAVLSVAAPASRATRVLFPIFVQDTQFSNYTSVAADAGAASVPVLRVPLCGWESAVFVLLLVSVIRLALGAAPCLQDLDSV